MGPLYNRTNPNRDVFSNNKSFTTTLLILLIDTFTTEVLEWTPQTIQLEIYDVFKSKVPTSNLDKIMVGINLITTDIFYKNLPSFNEFCQILNNEPYQPGIFDLADLDDCAWGITETLLLAPPEKDDDEPFSDEIRAFLGSLIKDNGLLTPPDILKLAIHDPKKLQQVSYDFSDDPEMFMAITQTEQDRTSDINNSIKSKLYNLFNQVATLSLTNGKVEQITSKLLGNLASMG